MKSIQRRNYLLPIGQKSEASCPSLSTSMRFSTSATEPSLTIALLLDGDSNSIEITTQIVGKSCELAPEISTCLRLVSTVVEKEECVITIKRRPFVHSALKHWIETCRDISNK